MEFFGFKRSIEKKYLKLSQVAYGGEFYYDLRNYQLKDLNFTYSRFKKCYDNLLKKINSNRFYSFKNENSGFNATVFENIKTKEIVIAYRGTERIGLGENFADLFALGKDVKTDLNLILGNIDDQFTDALEFYAVVKNENPKAKIVLCGQSLGGALAQLVAAKVYSSSKKKVKTFTYNAPGCMHILEAFKCDTKLNYSFITNYAVMNDWCGMFGEHIGETYLIPPFITKALENSIVAQQFENVLLSTHEGIFDYSGYVIKKPNNFGQNEGLSLWYFDINNPIKDFENPSDIIKTLTTPVEVPTQIQAVGKSIQDKVDNFMETYAPQIQEISSQIQNATNEFFDQQKDKFLEIVNSNTINQIAQFTDETFSKLTTETLKNAVSVLKELKIDKTHKEYIKNFDKYFN